MNIFVTTFEMASLESDGIISASLSKSDMHLENFLTCLFSSSYIYEDIVPIRIFTDSPLKKKSNPIFFSALLNHLWISNKNKNKKTFDRYRSCTAVLFIKWGELPQEFLFIVMHLDNSFMFYIVLFSATELEVMHMKGPCWENQLKSLKLSRIPK